MNFVRLEDGSDSRDEALLSQVEKFWKTDFVDTLSSTKLAMSVEDERALKLMEDSVVKVSGHYQVALPWRFQPPYLLNNRIAAEQRLQLLRNKFLRDEEFFRKYKDTINDYIAKGYARRVPDEQLDVIDKPLWYLPHHAVFHSRKPDKLRIVFDCATKFRGTSLNDQLMHDPDLTNNLFGVLNRFRQEAIALVSDIEGMFHQVKVDPKDYDALRFLWWQDGDLTQQPVEYRMVVHLFGSTSSPSCASFCLRKTALDNKGDFGHQVIDTVLKNFYVDDCLKTVSSKAVAVQLRIDLCHLLSRDGFRLTKWLCNDKDVLETIPKFERARSVLDLDLSNQNLPHERTLGVQWNMNSDTFTFKVEPKQKPFTRRGILSMTSSVYDPLGLVSPVIVPAKKLLQDLCQQKIGWDDEIALEELTRWKSWISGLPKLSQVAIPRHLRPADLSEVRSCHLHHFADASQVAYGAVAYVRFVSANRQIHCSFLTAKSRLAHVKPMTIPRLELSAAVLAVRIDRALREELELTIDKSVFWSDSTSVLQYIRNQGRRFRTFVANLLAVIRDGSQPTQWKYVPTSDNPADLVSRGASVEELIHQSRWFSGPKFLWKEESSLPTMPKTLKEISEGDPEIKKEVQIHFSSAQPLLDSMIQRYSSWYKLKRGVARLLQFIKSLQFRLRLTKNLTSLPDTWFPPKQLSVEDIKTAEIQLIKYVQRSSFPYIMAILKRETPARQQKSELKCSEPFGLIYKLRPWLDQSGILGVGGRLENAQIDYEAKHQTLLPYNHHVSCLIIMAHHELVGHFGTEYVLASLRQKYWIVKGRAMVRKVIGRCLICRRYNVRRGQQLMADLPSDRLTPDNPPFTHVAIDFFGPLYVKRGRSILKHYGCLFTCLTMRATHIEVTESLDTDSFINTLRRFISRTGCPRIIRSDNGTNLSAGEKEIRDAINTWNHQKIEKYLQQKDIQWKFNPLGASHMGGVWECVIRSVRKVIRCLTKEQLVSGEALRTLMTEIECILNGRPLTPSSHSPGDLEALTPNHLLLFRPNNTMPPGIFSKDDMYCRRRWRQIQYLSNVFWKRWLSEYLPTLQVD